MKRALPLFGFAAPLVSLALLVGLEVEQRAYHLPPGDPAPYHARIRGAAASLPLRVGEWVGEAVEPPSASVSMLKPNVLLGYQYRNARTGQEAMLVVVQCRDARDLSGHWPPVCYPSHGWLLKQQAVRSVRFGGRGTPMMTHVFTIESPGQFSEVTTYSMFALPGEALQDQPDGVRRAAESRRMRGFGAAQIQVVFSGTMTWDDMDQVAGMLLDAAVPVVAAVQEWEPS